MSIIRENKEVFVFIGASILTYNAVLYLRRYLKEKKNPFVPVGVVKELYVYPVKSFKGKSVFSLHCGAKGVSNGQNKDRHFQVIDGETGMFYTARQKPKMILVEADVHDDNIYVKFPSGKEVVVNLLDVNKRNDVRRTILHQRLHADGLDCGDDISEALSEYLEEKNVRLVVYIDGLYTERDSVSKQSWWNNTPVPKRIDNIVYADEAPYLIQTEASLDDLNSRLPDKKVTQLQFRPVIVIDKCPAWDEDKWLELRFGDCELQCFRPCTRCILTTVDPTTGKKDPDMQPLKKLREYRLAPDGPMRKEFGESPVFGVHAGLLKPGYIHVGQVMYARHKDSEF